MPITHLVIVATPINLVQRRSSVQIVFRQRFLDFWKTVATVINKLSKVPPFLERHEKTDYLFEFAQNGVKFSAAF